MISVTGYDCNNIPRVYGRHERDEDIALTRARETALDYVRGRPDTGPLDRWTFERDVADRQMTQGRRP